MTRILLLALVASGAAAPMLAAQEKKIERSDLPAAVEKTVAAQTQGAAIRGFSMETEGGTTYYEVEMMTKGHTKDISMTADGTITEVEEQVTMASLPSDVRAGLRAAAGKGTIGKIESLTKSGKLVAYEAHVTTNGKRSEIQVGPDGAPLAHEE